METEWFFLGLGGFEPPNNFLYFIGMPVEIYCSKWKDCLSEERKNSACWKIYKKLTEEKYLLEEIVSQQTKT